MNVWGRALILVFCLSLLTPEVAEARRKRRSSKRQRQPPVTHPMVLWSRTISQGGDLEQRRIAAYKLSQYSQRIFPSAVIATLLACVKDPDLQIKVFCTKAMGNAGTASTEDSIRAALLDRFHNDPTLRNTVVRALIVRRDRSSDIQDTLLAALKTASGEEDRLTLLSYFEQFGQPSDSLVNELIRVYKAHEDSKTRRASVKVLVEKGKGQGPLIDLLADCALAKDTPLSLICLSGLQNQAKSDARSWAAVEKTIMSDDADVLMASLDLVNVLPETSNTKVSQRLLDILDDAEDSEIQEKAILGLGSAGDRSEGLVKALLKILEETSYDESIQIAAALSLGQQATGYPEKPTEFLSLCKNSGRTQAIRTACALGLDDLTARKAKQVSGAPQTPVESPAPPAGT